MSWDTALTEHGELLAFTAALADGSARTVAFKLAFARAVLAGATPGDTVAVSKLENLLEDLSHSLSVDEARDVLLRSGLLEPTSGTVDNSIRVPTQIAPQGAFLEDEDETGILQLPVSRFLELLELHHRGNQQMQGTAGLTDCIAAIDATSHWGAELAKDIELEHRDGVPVFWDCTDEGHKPFALDPGTLTTTDTLLLILERVRRGLPIPSLDPLDLSASVALVHRLMGLQRSKRDWNEGGFSVPAWDDDFLGSFDKEHPELGPCPTVDASGGAVVALCAALRVHLLSHASTYLEEHDQRARAAVEGGVQFLLRAQLPTGGWPVYRYEDDRFVLPAREISSRYAVEALADAAYGDYLAPHLLGDVRAAASRYLEWVLGTARRASGECAWLPDFTRGFASDGEQVQATATVWLTLEVIGRTWPDLDLQISPLRSEVTAFVERVWEPRINGFVRIPFRVPTWTGPGDTFTYEWPSDPVVVSMLIAAAGGGCISLQSRTTEKIGRAIGSFLMLQLHGHWNDFLMDRQGIRRGVPPNTIQYHRALLDYLQWQAVAVRRFWAVQAPECHQTGRSA